MGDLTPNTREEYFLARMAGEDVTMPEPITREEEYMKWMAEAINGNNDVKIPEPLTREEQYLKTVTEKIAVETKTLKEKTVTTNGVYKATDDNADGYSKVTVNVAQENTFKSGTEFVTRTALNKASIPSGYTSIGNQAFNGFTSLASIEIPSGVTSIGEQAFNGCTSLASIDLPSGITSIGTNAFNDCRSLASITCRATTPPTLGSNALFKVPTDIPIYVPVESVDTYKAASGWSARADYIQAIPTT